MVFHEKNGTTIYARSIHTLRLQQRELKMVKIMHILHFETYGASIHKALRRKNIPI